jgi:glutamate synthase (NADPH/NADH) large chain
MAWSGRRSKLIAQARPALENKSRVKIEMSIRNVNRTVGAMLSGEIAQRWGMLDYRTIRSHQDESTAGRSFGAFWLAV